MGASKILRLALPAFFLLSLAAGFHSADEGLAYFLDRTKLPKLERFPRWYLIESSSYCAAYSATHR